MKIKNWDGKDLSGTWIASIKIDGVRMLRSEENGRPISRNGKPLYNLDHVPESITDCEVYLNSWEETVSLVRTKSAKDVPETAIYSLNPLDDRLYISELTNPTSYEIEELLEKYINLGYEGIVLRGDKCWYKAKKSYTIDLEVLGTVAGKGRLEGKLGAIITKDGNVGTGFTDKERDVSLYPIGSIIEVEFMERTPSGKLRHPRFLRRRFDK